MDRRRAVAQRPEEIQCWSHAKASLGTLAELYSSTGFTETIGRVNRLIDAWPSDDQVPAEGPDSVKTVSKKLAVALSEMKSTLDKETRVLDEAIENLDVLIALRSANEMPSDKRNKRPRAPSPAGSGLSATTPSAGSRGVSITIPLRSSVGPTPAIPFSREPKARREALAKQLPLQEGRKVAFHPPAGKPGDASGTAGEEGTWILAVVTRCINQDKNRYEVQDVEPQEDGQPGQRYNTTLRAIIPLPDPNVPPTSAAHLDAYHEFPEGARVMALYPDTSCFYRAAVLASPSEMQRTGGTKQARTYKLKFDDDGDQVHNVSALWVVEDPN